MRPIPEPVLKWPRVMQEVWTELAGKYQYDGEMDGEDADKRAMYEVLDRHLDGEL